MSTTFVVPFLPPPGGTVLGALYTSGGIGAMVGPPLVGLIIDRTGSYRVAIACAFAVALVSFALLIPLRRYEPAATRSSAASD